MASSAPLTPEEIDLLEPTFIDPSWQKDARALDAADQDATRSTA